MYFPDLINWSYRARIELNKLENPFRAIVENFFTEAMG